MQPNNRAIINNKSFHRTTTGGIILVSMFHLKINHGQARAESRTETKFKVCDTAANEQEQTKKIIRTYDLTENNSATDTQRAKISQATQSGLSSSTWIAKGT
jgi:hypothetical protein